MQKIRQIYRQNLEISQKLDFWPILRGLKGIKNFWEKKKNVIYLLYLNLVHIRFSKKMKSDRESDRDWPGFKGPFGFLQSHQTKNTSWIHKFFFYKNIVFWAQAGYSYQNLDSQAEIILRIFLFLPLYSRILLLLLFSRILQFQPQGIPRIFLIFYEISAWYSYKLYSYKKKCVI